MSKFENLPKEVIMYMALAMDLPEVLSLCGTSKKFNINICENPHFWIRRLKQDFNIRYLDIKDETSDPKTYYQFFVEKSVWGDSNKIDFAANKGYRGIVKY